MAIVLIGLVVGGVGWYEVDRTLAFGHILAWLVGIVIVFAGLAWLILRNPILSIGIDDIGLTIERAGGTRKFAWADIQAARFQDYPVLYSGGQTLTCFLLRAGGKSFELTPEFRDDATRVAFQESILRELESRDIPETSKGLPSFERLLSLTGAWIFVASIVAMLAAHALQYHTLGTIFGSALLLTGSVMAWMTRRERPSRLVLAATLVLIVAGSAILWACHVNVRDVLQKWEEIEKR